MRNNEQPQPPHIEVEDGVPFHINPNIDRRQIPPYAESDVVLSDDAITVDVVVFSLKGGALEGSIYVQSMNYFSEQFLTVLGEADAIRPITFELELLGTSFTDLQKSNVITRDTTGEYEVNFDYESSDDDNVPRALSLDWTDKEKNEGQLIVPPEKVPQVAFIIYTNKEQNEGSTRS